MKVYGQLEYAQLQHYTQATRPVSGTVGQLIYVLDDALTPLQFWNASTWQPIRSGPGTGFGESKVIQLIGSPIVLLTVASAPGVLAVDETNPASPVLYVANSTTAGDWTALGASGADLAAHLADPTAAHTASAISNTPTGNLAATDVQAALNELQSDIDTRSLSSHTHAASVITNTPSGNLAATNVQAALNELQSDIDTRSLSSHTHAASAITNTPSGNLAATDVQAALNELQSDIDVRSLSSHTHAASAITNTPSGNLAATDVQTALNELQTDIDTRATSAALTTHAALTTGVHGVTGTVVGTSDAQTLSAKTFSDAITLTQIATPANPAASKNKLYTKSDDKLYLLSSAGVETAVGSGGGGGGSLQWVEDDSSPEPAIDSHVRVYKFQSFATSAVTQNLYAMVKVPASYTAGSQVTMKLTAYSPDSSGTMLMQSVSTLVRTGTDVISSTTNQRTSTNAAITLGAGTVSKPQALSLDLSSSTGQINGVSISAGDLILVALKRATDTATSDVNVPVYGAEVTFA
jgi:CHASE3 domain sensor protein